MTNRAPKRWVALLATVTLTAFFSFVGAALAYAFSEEYGPAWTCASGCYISSAGAHTFVANSGWTDSGGAPYLACQLFNYSGEDNVVTHGTTSCYVSRGNNGHYVWARVYNESGGSGSEYLAGYAHTN